MDSDYVDSILERASELLEAGQPDAALRRLDRLEGELLEGEDRTEYGALRACVLAELGRFDDALDLLEPLLDEFPDAAGLHAARGIVLSSAEVLDEARAALEQAVALDEEDETAIANLALVCEKMREYEQAIRLYDRAMELGADIDWLLQRKAATQAELGDYAGAKPTLKRYLSLVPDDAAQWVTLAILHSDDEEFEQAAACYRMAEQLEPESAALRLNWGVTAVRGRDLAEARRQCEHLQQIIPDSARTLLLQAFILEEDDDLSAAQTAYDEALARIRPDDYDELTYALEMAMDFFARHEMTRRCEQLFAQAYAANACTVELCEAYREATAQYRDESCWFSLAVEADYRPGLSEVRAGPPGRIAPPATESLKNGPPTRFLRIYQIVAPDRDAATAGILDFMRLMGETGACIREFTNEDHIEDVRDGIYEVDRDSVVFS